MSADAPASTLWWRFAPCHLAVLLSVLTGLTGLSAGEAEPPTADVMPTIAVEELVARARRLHPRAALGQAERAIAAATQRRAHAWRDPEVEVEVGRSAARAGGDDQTIASLTLRQPLDLGGRGARIAAADHGLAAATAASEADWLEVEHAVRAAVMECWKQMHARSLANQGAALGRQVLAIAERRVAAGEAPRADLLRAQIDGLRAGQIAAERGRAVVAALDQLRLLCGDQPGWPGAPVAAGLPALAQAETAGAAHPRLRAAAADLAQATATLTRERAARWPEISLGGFAAREADADEYGVVVGVAVPLWDGNRSAVDAAIAGVRRAEAVLAVARLDQRRAITAAWHAATQAGERAAGTQAVLVPARAVLALAQRGYEGGESPFTDLLEARRTLQQVEDEALSATAERHLAHLALQHAIGSFIPLAGAPP